MKVTIAKIGGQYVGPITVRNGDRHQTLYFEELGIIVYIDRGDNHGVDEQPIQEREEKCQVQGV